MNRKIVAYIGVVVIGIGFIMMAANSTLNSETHHYYKLFWARFSLS